MYMEMIKHVNSPKTPAALCATTRLHLMDLHRDWLLLLWYIDELELGASSTSRRAKSVDMVFQVGAFSTSGPVSPGVCDLKKYLFSLMPKLTCPLDWQNTI